MRKELSDQLTVLKLLFMILLLWNKMELCVIFQMELSFPYHYRIFAPLIYIFSEVRCYYSTIPLFSAYNSILSQQKEMNILFNSTSVLINDVEYVNISQDGCLPAIITDAPTEAPETPSRF